VDGQRRRHPLRQLRPQGERVRAVADVSRPQVLPEGLLAEEPLPADRLEEHHPHAEEIRPRVHRLGVEVLLHPERLRAM